MPPSEPLRFHVEGAAEVSALLVRPKNSRWLLVLAHGAGAGMTHPFMEKLSDELGAVGVAAFRYQFPSMEQRRPVGVARPPAPPRGEPQRTPLLTCLCLREANPWAAA